MTDLIERLKCAIAGERAAPVYRYRLVDLCDEAVYEILKLRSRVRELEDVIEDMKELENAAYARGVRDGIDRIRVLLGEILDGSTKGD